MGLSSITGVTQEGQPEGLASFLRSGVMYVVWADNVGLLGASRKVRWKPHTSGDYTETLGALTHVFKNISVIYHPSTDAVVVTWDDGTSSPNQANGNVYVARFSFLTGALLSGPTRLNAGAYPRICYRTSNLNEMLLYFCTPKTGGVYGQMSSDGGLTWQSAEPFLTGQVLSTSAIRIVPYDATHISISQVGTDPRALSEIGLYSRTRPISSIVKHPTVANQFYIGEPSKGPDNVTLVDNLRGALKLATDNGSLFHLDGIQQGTSDSIGAVSLVSVSGSTISNVSSVGPVGGVAGRNLVQYTLALAAGSLSLALPGASSYAVDVDVSANYAYVAEYSDSTTNGQFVVVKLSDATNATILSAITGVRAVAVANFASPALIFVATTESGVERLRIYQENGLSPTLLMNVKLPARVNNLSVVAGTGGATARIIVSMVDRFGVYDYYTPSVPVRCSDTYQFSGGGQFFRSVSAPNGNVFVAAGASGVVVFDSSSRVLAQLKTSGESVSRWRPATAYSLNQLVVPTPKSPFAPNRYYFKCTAAGTSGSGEPAWSTTGTMSDATVTWTPVAVTDGIVSDLALDVSTKRIYAVGSAGGNLGTDGRVWILSVGGFL